jgi:hypothetical protein
MSSISWKDTTPQKHRSSVITSHNRRQALEILHHDPLYIEPTNQDDIYDNREAISLLFHTNKLPYVDVTMGPYQHKRRRSCVCGGYCLLCRCKILLCSSIIIVVLVLVAMTQLDGPIASNTLPNTLHRHQDICRRIFNKSIEELRQDVSNYSSPNEWCDFDHADCKCQSTIQASPPEWSSHAKRNVWNQTLQRNVKLASQTHQVENEWDVVFYGDSITEHWLGTELTTRREQWQGTQRVFEEYFDSSNGAAVDGLALGIAGDQVRWDVYWDVTCWLISRCDSKENLVFFSATVRTVAVQISKR